MNSHQDKLVYHAIELEEGSKPWEGVHIILLSTEEHKALQYFFDESLKAGQIIPCKSSYYFSLKVKMGSYVLSMTVGN